METSAADNFKRCNYWEPIVSPMGCCAPRGVVSPLVTRSASALPTSSFFIPATALDDATARSVAAATASASRDGRFFTPADLADMIGDDLEGFADDIFFKYVLELGHPITHAKLRPSECCRMVETLCCATFDELVRAMFLACRVVVGGRLYMNTTKMARRHAPFSAAKSDANSRMHAFHVLIDSTASRRRNAPTEQEPGMLSFAEFQEICRRSPQVLQSVVITQAVLLRRFAAVAWTAHRPKWAERHPEYCQESFSLTHAHERIVKRGGSYDHLDLDKGYPAVPRLEIPSERSSSQSSYRVSQAPPPEDINETVMSPASQRRSHAASVSSLGSGRGRGSRRNSPSSHRSSRNNTGSGSGAGEAGGVTVQELDSMAGLYFHDTGAPVVSPSRPSQRASQGQGSPSSASRGRRRSNSSSRSPPRSPPRSRTSSVHGQSGDDRWEFDSDSRSSNDDDDAAVSPSVAASKAVGGDGTLTLGMLAPSWDSVMTRGERSPTGAQSSQQPRRRIGEGRRALLLERSLAPGLLTKSSSFTVGQGDGAPGSPPSSLGPKTMSFNVDGFAGLSTPVHPLRLSLASRGTLPVSGPLSPSASALGAMSLELPSPLPGNLTFVARSPLSPSGVFADTLASPLSPTRSGAGGVAGARPW